MISVEVACRAAMGKDVLWIVAGEALAGLADLLEAGDPYYNPHFTLLYENYGYK